MFHLIESKTKRTVITHFERDNPRWLINLFKVSTIFPSLAIAYDVEEFLSKNSKRVVLITNYNCVRGIEFSDVILLLDANEYHLKQFIPEAMTRCQSNLPIVIIPAENVINQGDVVIDIVEHWKNINLAEEGKVIQIFKLDFCKSISGRICRGKVGHENLYCRKAKEEDTVICYEIHKKCDGYKKISEEIKRKIVKNISSDGSRRKSALDL